MTDFVDLHMHTTHSDGRLPPERVVELARAAGLHTISLTDHDTISSLAAARVAARRQGIEVLPGVELSLVVDGVSVHLLVYAFDEPSPFTELLAELQQTRRDRVPLMLARLAELGCPLTEEEVRAEAGGELIGRLHFAEALRRRGHVRTNQEAFDRYIGQGKPAHVEREHVSAEDVIRVAQACGGVTVMAHPGATPTDAAGKERILARLIAAGLDGIEVWHPSHGRQRERFYLERAQREGLIATGGSDFHGRSRSEVSIGRGRGKPLLSTETVAQIRERSATHAAKARPEQGQGR